MRARLLIPALLLAAIAVVLLISLGGGEQEEQQGGEPSTLVEDPERFVDEQTKQELEEAERKAREEEEAREKRQERRRVQRQRERRQEAREQARGPEPLRLRITVLDDTEQNPPRRFDVRPRDGEFWRPNFNLGVDDRSIEMTTRTLFIYPRGRQRERLAVRLAPPPALDLDDRHALTITIGDRVIRVIGSVVPGVEKRLRRS